MARTGLRERKKEQTRLELLQAAVELFSDKGYEDTTVDDIVERANYSRSTFFRYFGGKEDVVFADLPERFHAMFVALEHVDPHVDPFRAAREVMAAAFLEFISVAPELETACISLWFSEPALQRRYMAMVVESEERLAQYFGRAWGVDPKETVECAAVAAGIVAVARTIIRTQLTDRVAVRRTLDRGFDALEQGVARTTIRMRKRALSARRIAAGD